MKALRLIITIGLVCTLHHFAHAEIKLIKEGRTIDVHSLTPENGLSHSRIRASFRDEFGFLWVATEDGLNRYDGCDIDVFRPNEKSSIATNVITDLCGDYNGHLFFIGRQSLSVLDLRSQEFSMLRKTDIKAITFKDGLLYYVEGCDVFTYNINTNEHIKVFSYLQKSTESITHICIDKQGSIYLSFNNDEILKIADDKHISRYRFTGLHHISSDDKGNIWLTSRSEGFSVIKPDGTKQDFRISDDISHAIDWNNVRNIVQASDNEYFVGTYAGLALLNTDTWILTPYDYEMGISGFKSKAVSNLHYSDGILFIGTFHAGLHYYIRENDIYQTYGPTRQDIMGISSPIVSSIIKDKREVLWIGTVSGGLNVIDPLEKISPELKRKLNSEYLTNIKHLYYDEEEDAIYASMFSEGICRIDPKRATIRKASPIFKDKFTGKTHVSQNITKLIPIDKSHSIILSLDGVAIMDNEKMELEYLITTAIQGTIIYDMVLDSNSNLWITTEGSLSRINLDKPDIYRTWPTDEIRGMSGESFITTLFMDKEGRIWLGSNGSGLFLWDEKNENFKNWSVTDGLDNGYINYITQSRVSGTIYLATNKGVSSFNPISEEFENHNISKGFPLTITDRLYTSADSTLYACSINGILAINENTLHSRHKDYQIHIKKINVYNSNARDNDESSILTSALYQNKIELSGDVSSLSLDIVNSSLDPLLTTAFEYHLDGFDDKFILAHGNQIRYTNLSPGKYTLTIRGTIPQSNGEYPTKVLTIIIHPPFWKSWWFISIIAALCLSVIAFIIISYIRASKLKVMFEVEKREKLHEKQLSQAKTSFLTNISHEFRTPLTLINSHVEIILQKHSLDPEIYNNVLGAYKNSQKLREMIDEFINLNRTENAEIPANILPYSANDIVNEIYLLFSDYAVSRNIRYKFESCSLEPVIKVDYNQMSRAITNLVSNAFKYTKDTISLEVRCSDQKVCICVKDNGVGIGKEHLDKIFSRFYQEDRANKEVHVKGSGIGLSYAKEIVSRHGGEISVESTPNENTVFCICLKRCEEDVQKTPLYMPCISEKETDIEPSEIEREDITVLLVEDNKDVLNILSEIFSAYYSVITAENGKAGLEIAAKYQPDLIISDVMMPEMSGTEMCRQLKDNFSTSHIPIILLTALGTEMHTLDGLTQGADDYITKPFNSRILLARCNNLIKSRKTVHEKYAHNASETEKILTENPIDSKLLNDAITIIEANINESDFDILFFARQLCLSRTQLFKKIKSLTGMTPNMFVLSIKLKRASQEILANPNENITEIAYRCGFNTPSYFIKCFKKFYGETPLSFRKKNRK